MRGSKWLLIGAVLTGWGLTACAGGDGSGGTPAAPNSPGSTASASPARQPPLSVAALKSVALTGDDVPGSPGISADERTPADTQSTFPPASDVSCQKMLDALGAHGASAVVDQIFNWKGSIWAGGGTLASYRDTGAEQAFTQVRTSLTTCSDFKGVGYTGKFTAHVERERLPRLGDESIALRITTPVAQPAGLRSGKRVSVRSEENVLVRVGNVTAHFTMLNMDHDDHFPLPLIRKELARIAEAQRSGTAVETPEPR
ncbi:hypothetical protein ACFW9X_23225 [Streptomyces sp. NPDC059466]|uniref:hypothetical protein n=1 Tax=Streptomyces sp. NPDC059466 TaxID=3346843 RepID=UPI00369B7015